MANAKSGVHVVQLKPIVVPKNLVDGCKFVKWDDDTGVGVPVVLKVDRKGFFLYWTDQNGDTEFLEISSIRDTRTGRYAKTPRTEGKLKESINIGPQDIALEDKTLTVVYGADFVNVNFINFCTYAKEIAQEWAEQILKIAYNLLAHNASVYTFLEKAHTKLCLMTDRDKKLPVKNILKMFASHKDDRKRVEKALEACALPSGKNEAIPLEKFDMATFFNFYNHLIGRQEVLRIYKRICQGKESLDSEDQDMLDELLGAGDSSPANSGAEDVIPTTASPGTGGASSTGTDLMTLDQFVQFLNKIQRDPRLNEILYPYVNRTRGLDLIDQYEPDRNLAQKGLLSFEGFLRYLMSDDNAIIPADKFDLNCDMDQPLSHYFINSSHNTYLTGHQFTGKSSVEIYRQCLLGGCRCIELDVWNGDDEPIITHGYTVVTQILLKEVLEAIAESAFKTSPYPVILSFENHCSNKQQLAKMARYCREILGPMLLTEPLPSHPLRQGVPLPSPNQLLRRILIKDKKEHKPKHNRKNKQQQQQQSSHEQQANSSISNNDSSSSGGNPIIAAAAEQKQESPAEPIPAKKAESNDLIIADGTTNVISNSKEEHSAAVATNPAASGSGSIATVQKNFSCDMGDIMEPLMELSDGGSTTDDDDANESITGDLPSSSTATTVTATAVATNLVANPNQTAIPAATAQTSPSTATSIITTTASQTIIKDEQQQQLVPVKPHHHHHHHHREPGFKSEMSELVIYVQPIQFRAFDVAEKRNRSFEVSSFDETQSTSLLKEQPVEFVNYNKRQLSRIYPKGTRVNSSNYMPQIFWNAGCQMVALNFQTLDLGMQLNLGIFEYNGRNGYLLKPDFMRRQDRRFDPFTESTVDGIIAGTVSIKIISGQFLSDKRVGTYVEVDMYGLPADTVRRKRTKTIPNNALNPVYDEEPFVFKKVVLPDLACIRIAAFEENGKFIGTRILPFVGLRPGYRHISLRNESLHPLTLPTLFVHIQVKDYIPDGLSEWANALANPIAYQSLFDKRDKQLMAFGETDESLMLMDGLNDGAGDLMQSQDQQPAAATPMKPSSVASMSRQTSQAELSLHSIAAGRTAATAAAGGVVEPMALALTKMELNGGAKNLAMKSFGSPTHRMSRQDTLNRNRTNQLLQRGGGGGSGSADGCGTGDLATGPGVAEKSLLETSGAGLEAEPVEKLKQSKNVQKIFGKIERDIQTLTKKYEKHREKLKEAYVQALEKNRKFSVGGGGGVGSLSAAKSLKKIGSKKVLQFESFDAKSVGTECKNKILEIQKTFSESVLNSYLEQYKEEFKVFETRYEQLCQALDKAMEESQAAQRQYLDGLHDKDVATLMKRLEAQQKNELSAKSNKDKNELARIKRELQQKLIDQAVNERQRLQILLDKRKLELAEKHKKEEKRMQEEKRRMMEEREREFRHRCQQLQRDYEANGQLFIQRFGLPMIEVDTAAAGATPAGAPNTAMETAK